MHYLFKTTGDLAQQFVTQGMPQGIVHHFEAIQIQQHHSDKTLGTSGVVDGLINPVVQQYAIGKPGQQIVGSLVLKLLFIFLLGGDIPSDMNIIILTGDGGERRCRHLEYF